MLRRMRFFTGSILMAAMFIVTLYSCGVIVNVSDSMPIGFYYKTSQTDYHRGDIVGVHLEGELKNEALERHYVPLQKFSKHLSPMLKQLIAVPGDTIFRTPAIIQVNQIIYPAPVRLYDHNGKSINFFHHEPNGVTTRYWLYGNDDVVHSWDSRYFGGVDKSRLIGIYKPFLVYNVHRITK